MSIVILSSVVLAICISFCQHVLVIATCNPHSCNNNGFCTGSGDDAFCVCDIGVKSSETSDCNVKICPKSDDPITENQSYRAISLSLVTSDKYIQGSVEFSFLGESIVFDANPWKLTKEELASTLKRLQNIEEVDVTGGKVDRRGSSTFTITFTSWPTIPHENNIYYHDGNPHISSFTCESLIEDISCNIQNVKIPQPTSITEYVTCSNHGRCNENTGLCECHLGWTDEACDNNDDSLDVEVIISDGPNFSGNLLKLQSSTTTDGGDNSFNFINAIAGRKEKNMFRLTGDGSIFMTGDLNIESGSAEVKGERGIIIETSSPYYRAIDASSPGGAARLHGSGSNYSSSVLLLSVDDHVPSSNFKFLEAKIISSNESLFEVDGNGHILSNGATIGADGIIMNEGDLKLAKGSGILIEKNGGLTIEDGSSIFKSSKPSTPVVVISQNDNLENTEHHKSSPLLLIESKRDHFQNDSVEYLMEIKAGETSVFKVDSAGVAHVRGGVSVENGSIDILSGGLNVISGGASIEGGIQLKSGLLRIENEAGIEILGGIESTISSSSHSAFTGKVSDPNYSGIILNIEGPEVSSNYKFLQMSSDSKELFSVDSNGEITSRGIHSKGDIISDKNLSIRGGASMKKKCMPASDTIEVHDISTIAFLEITDDNYEAKNNLHLLGIPLENQLLYVKNSDLQSLGGNALGDIPPLALILFVYMDSQGWVDVTATAAHKRDLTGVKKLEAKSIMADSIAGASLIVTSKVKENDLGQVVFFGSGGVLKGDEGITYNPESETLSVSKISAGDFVGDSLDFHGGVISSATLMNVTIENLKYLIVENLAINSMRDDNNKIGDDCCSKMVMVDNRGTLHATTGVIWNAQKKQLVVPALSSPSRNGIKIDADVDMSFKKVRNAVIEEGTVFRKLHFKDGVISNSILNNVTAENLKLGGVEVESIAVSTLSNLENTGAVITIGQGGKLIPSESFIEHEGNLQITKTVLFKESIDLGHNNILNPKITGGSVTGPDVVINVKSIMADSIGLSEKNDTLASKNAEDNLLVIDRDGYFKRGSMSLREGGIIDSLKVGDFQANDKATFQGGAEINGDTFIDGSLTVSASVLGSGPYVDVSDIRLKKEIVPLSSSVNRNRNDSSILQKILKLKGVTYELNDKVAKIATKSVKKSPREIGFIAQDVEALFPDLVDKRSNGFLGLKYARFVPIITEGFKELNDQMMELQRENDKLRTSIQVLTEKIINIEMKMK